MCNKYLFAYCKGNEPENESINFAVSEDGYKFTPLNGNEPFLFNEKGTKGIRDPFLVRAVDGSFYIVGTDMRSELGWASNHAICIWHSDDLINWKQYESIDMEDYGLIGSVRTWAPEVFYDKEKEMYMIYWANAQHNKETDEWTNTVMWYAYTKDFTRLETQPQILYAPPSKKDAIDADIIEHDGTYYMYYKDENEKFICYVYSKGGYAMQETTDLVNFTKVDDEKCFFDFSPRHGSMLHISDEEYDRLVAHFGK